MGNITTYRNAEAAAKSMAAFGEKGFLFGFLATQWVHTGKADAKGNKAARDAGKVTLREFADLAQMTDDSITNYRKVFAYAATLPEYAAFADILAPADTKSVAREVPTEFTTAVKDRNPLFTAAGWRAVSVALKDSRKTGTTATPNASESATQETPARRTRADVTAELERAKARVIELEQELAALPADDLVLIDA